MIFTHDEDGWILLTRVATQPTCTHSHPH